MTTLAQVKRIVQLCGELSLVRHQTVEPDVFMENRFDLPPGWVYVELGGIAYGVDPEGRASS